MFSHTVAYESSVVSDQLLLRPLFQISMVVAYVREPQLYVQLFFSSGYMT